MLRNRSNLELSSKQRLKRGYMELIYKNNPRYFLTITFPFNTSKSSSEAILNKLIINLNQKIYKKRYTNNIDHISGVAIREQTQTMYCDHFHIVIFEHKDHLLPNIESMNKKINKCISFINRTEGTNYIHTFDLQEYYKTGEYSLERYVTKQFDGYTYQNTCNDAMGILGRSDVIFN